MAIGHPHKFGIDFKSQVRSLDVRTAVMEFDRMPNKFAPVVPFHFYRQFMLHDYKPGSVLLLAHDVVTHTKEYNEIFTDPFWDHTTIFMDNSLVELKAAVDISMVADAVDAIDRRQVVILPDAMADSEETIKLTKDAWPEWSWKFRNHKMLAVIQGNSMQSFLKCAEELEELKLDWVSIPRVTESLWGYHRRELIPYINAIFPHSKLHLLGFSNYIWEDLRAAGHYKVQSIDSAVPFRMKTFNFLSEEVGERGDWWETAQFNPDMLHNISEINLMISRMA